MEDTAQAVMERCDVLAGISEEPGLIVRPYGSLAMSEANGVVAGWMRMAGMTTRRDAFGNLVGRYEGTGEKALVLGSHLDTVRDAGKYDGILGVTVALACVQRLHDRGERLPYALEGGGRPDEDLLGYCEVHIEQGPVLEERDLQVGVVTAINGQSRVKVGFVGKAGHAGTVPMGGRRDALCAAAEFVLEVEAAAKAEPGAVATVGEITAHPGAVNVIPGVVEHSLDLRHADDAVRGRIRDHLEGRAGEIAASRGCEHRWQVRQEGPAVPMDPDLGALLEMAVEGSGIPVHRLPSGAGHDAAQMAALSPVAMLFVRCKEGISHNPAESVRREDAGVAIEVMGRFLTLLAQDERAGKKTGTSREVR
jgi:allantoate deiminase